MVAPHSLGTISALESKHPAPADGIIFPDPSICPDPLLQGSPHFKTTAPQLIAAMSSFRSNSAVGLTPQHLKGLLTSGPGEAGESLLKELAALTNLIFSGGVNDVVVDFLYGANLCALGHIFCSLPRKLGR